MGKIDTAPPAMYYWMNSKSIIDWTRDFNLFNVLFMLVVVISSFQVKTDMIWIQFR